MGPPGRMTPSLIENTADEAMRSESAHKCVSPHRPARHTHALPVDGDDLLRAREFCSAARGEMDAILMADRGSDCAPGRDPHWLSERLSGVQRGAKRMRARAIYRSAQDVLSVVQGRHDHVPINWPIVDGRLVVLNKLIHQYSDGLDDVWQHYAANLTEENETDSPPINKLAAPAQAPVLKHYGADSAEKHTGLQDADLKCAEQTSPEAQTKSVHSRAQATLEALLPHARNDERAALQRLLEASRKPCQSEDKPLANADDRLDFVDALPELVQQWLGEGRDYGKTLSVSYALDGVRLSADQQQSLIDRLQARLSDLIAGSMPLQGIGHLDLVAVSNRLQITGSGFDPFEIDIVVNAAPVSDLDDNPIAVSPSEQTPPTPRITDDTEPDLRAQLAALMDGAGHDWGEDLVDSHAPDNSSREPG